MSAEFLGKLSTDAIATLSASGLGLTEYEIRVIFALAEGAKTASDLSEATGIPRTKTYEVLNRLVGKHLVQASSEKPPRHSLAPDALKRIIDSFQTISKTVLSVLNDLNKMYQFGAGEMIAEEIRNAAKSLGFMVEEGRPGSEFLFIYTIAGHRITLLTPSVASLDAFAKLSATIRSENPSAVLVPKEYHALFQQTGIPARAYSAVNVKETIFEIARELESASRRIDDLEKDFEQYCNEFDDKMGNNLSKIGGLQIPESTKNKVGGKLETIRNDLDGISLQQKSFSALWKTNLAHCRGVDALDTRSYETLKGVVIGTKGILNALVQKEKEVEELLQEVKRADEESSFPSLSVSPSPQGRKLIGPARIRTKVDEGIAKVKQTRTAQVLLIVGENGAGKTFLFRWYQDRINKGDFGRIVASYSTAKDDFLEVYNALMEDAMRALVSSERDLIWPPLLEKQANILNLDAAFARAANDLLVRNNIDEIVFMIDELEHGIQAGRVFADQLRYFMEKLENRPVLLILAISDSGYEIMSDRFPELLSRIPDSNIIHLEPFGDDGIKELAEEALSRAPNNARKEYVFSKEVLSEIREMSEGNPRAAIQLLNNLFYVAWKEKKLITPELVRKVSG
jgi:sugar-specific transcriptional regulator TrmB/chromosomal replication initiation ATPase DnaA